MYIVCLHAASDDYAVYSETVRNHYGTPLMYRGTFDKCLAFRKRMEGLM